LFEPNSFLDLAGRWLLDSGIQTPAGGVARYYRSDAETHCRVSTEITGYALSAFAYLHGETGQARYLEAARRAARFLHTKAWNQQAAIYPFEYSEDGDQAPALAYFFDSGIIARGFLALWRATGEAQWLAAAAETADSMARDFGPASAPHPILLLPEKSPAPRHGNWSYHPGCYQLKSAMAWLELYEATGEQGYLSGYEQSLAQALETHRRFLPGDDDPHRVMDRLHAYAYFLEGLLPRLDRPACAEAMRWGIQEAARWRRAIAPTFERSDVCAQLLRVRLYAAAAGVAELDFEAAQQEAEKAAAYQARSEDARVDGGYFFGRRNGEMVPHVNPVSTAFCTQALEMWRRHLEGLPLPSRQELI